jgi:hypothetical protein
MSISNFPNEVLRCFTNAGLQPLLIYAALAVLSGVFAVSFAREEAIKTAHSHSQTTTGLKAGVNEN